MVRLRVRVGVGVRHSAVLGRALPLGQHLRGVRGQVGVVRGLGQLPAGQRLLLRGRQPALGIVE